MESPVPVENPDPDDPVLMGIMAEILSEELAQENLQVPFLEFPTQEPSESEKRIKLWEDLKRSVEHRALGQNTR
jgi:hypothetical protein